MLEVASARQDCVVVAKVATPTVAIITVLIFILCLFRVLDKRNFKYYAKIIIAQK